MMSGSREILPDHIEETIEAIARLHGDHHRNASSIQHIIQRAIDIAGRPGFIGLMTAMLTAWIVVNLLAGPLDYRAFDPPPFSWLETIVSVVALYMVLLILVTQRHDDQLAQRRDQLTLELAVLSDRKTAKLIQLVEEMRLDNPLIHNRTDKEAEAMARPADPHSLLDAIRETHHEAEHGT